MVDITYEEFYGMMHQLYPDQSARVMAELRAAKLERLVQQLQEEENDGSSERSEPAASE